MMLNPEESIPKDDPEGAQGSGYTICINCHEDGTHDVVMGPLQPATEADHPDGMFGLETLEEVLRAVIALKGQGKEFRSSGMADMMNSYSGDETPRQAGGY